MESEIAGDDLKVRRVLGADSEEKRPVRVESKTRCTLPGGSVARVFRLSPSTTV